MITDEDVEMKTPALEQFLLELAKEAGADVAVLFDGSEIDLRVQVSD